MKRSIEVRDPKTLKIHPDVEAVLPLAEGEFVALMEDINERGILQPLIVDERDLVLDGRHRLRAAQELGLEQVEVRVHGEANPRLFALNSALLQRNLSVSGKVLMLFLAHPDLANGSKERRLGNLKKGQSAPEVTESLRGNIGENANFAVLAERYKVPREYFITLNTFRRDASDEDWDWAVGAIINDELSITRMRPGAAGRKMTGKKIQPRYNKIAKRSAKSLVNVFKEWGEIKWIRGVHDEHEITLTALSEAFSVMPPEVRAVTAESVLQWPDHERAALARALKEVRR